LEKKFWKICLETYFYRDMRMAKKAFQAAGYHLTYSRRKGHSGYYLADQGHLSPQLNKILNSIASEVDPRQIEIYHLLSPADHFKQGCAISDAARRVVAYRIRQQNPGISVLEANKVALQRAYRP
jgi:hypothetical protein